MNTPKLSVQDKIHMHKKLTLLLATYFLSLACAFSQTAPGIEWQNTIGGDTSDFLRSVEQTIDGGYIIGGWSNSNIAGDKTENSNGGIDFWIVKVDSLGNIQWQNTIGGDTTDQFSNIQQTFDGGYILGGMSYSNISGDKTENNNGSADFWVVKINAFGAIQWQNTIGGSGYDDLRDIKQTIDGGFILGGTSASNISGDKNQDSKGSGDYWIVKTDSLGNIQWQNTIGGAGLDDIYSLSQTNDGGFILGGYSNSNISGDKSENSNGFMDYWIVKTDASGNILWQNTIGGNSNDILFKINETFDNGYICGGFSDSNISGDKTENNIGPPLSNDIWIIKTDSIGNIQWENTIGGNDNDDCRSIIPTNDGGYIIGGFSRSNISGDKTENTNGTYDYWIIKTDAIGNIQWQNSIGGINSDQAPIIQQTTTNGYIIGGISRSNISGDKTENCQGDYDYWIVKLFPDTITSINNQQSSISNINISPNPFTDNLTISLNNPVTNNQPVPLFGITISLYDIMGKEVLSQPLTTPNLKLETSNLTKGVYFLKAGSQIKKVVKME